MSISGQRAYELLEKINFIRPLGEPGEKKAARILMEEIEAIGCKAVMEEFEAAKIPYGFATNSYNYDSDYKKGHLYYQGLGKNHLNSFLKDNRRLPASEHFSPIQNHHGS